MHNAELKTLENLKEKMTTIPGQLGMYYKNLESGFEYGIRENDAFFAASVIKFPLFMHVLNQCEEGRMSLYDKLYVENEEKVPSCGALNLFTDSILVDILTLCKLMICISDNTATNRLIKHCTIEGIEKGFVSMELEKTKIRRRLFDSEASARGIENTICPKEIGMLLEKLYKGEFINEEKSSLVLDVLKRQQINHKMGGKLKEVCIAHKTGEDYMLSNDVGIVFAKSPFILCFAGYDTDVYKWEDFIRNATYELFEAQSDL